MQNSRKPGPEFRKIQVLAFARSPWHRKPVRAFEPVVMMYHRRLRGYAELGYEVKLGGRDDAPCVIYTGSEYSEPFTADLSSAAWEIVISSPYIQKNRVKSLLPLLAGVPSTVYTAPPESYKPEYQSLVWYGDINPLSYPTRDADAIRFENADIAGELLDTLAGTGEQLRIEEL